MKKVKLYIACSLDGKIAKPDGDVEWLTDIPNPDNTDHGYAQFYASIDITLMGHNTYKEIIGYDIEFPYPGKTNYVFTRNKDLKVTEHVTFVSGDIVSFVSNLKKGNGKDMWLVGGGELNTLLLNEGLIDEFIVFVMPVIIGEGIPLFGKQPRESRLKLVNMKQYSTGAARLTYEATNNLLV